MVFSRCNPIEKPVVIILFTENLAHVLRCIIQEDKEHPVLGLLSSFILVSFPPSARALIFSSPTVVGRGTHMSLCINLDFSSLK